MKIVIQESALSDLRSGYRFYEMQESGLCAYFLDSLFSDIDSLQLYAGIHRQHLGRLHRKLSQRFPYAIYYDCDGSTAEVRAILDLRRDPAFNERRLKRLE